MQDSPADVMRGEETQIAGFLALNPNWDGVICLPGTHTKWAHISADEVISFQTYMTGDMFAALGDHTVLRHSVQSDDWDWDAFDTAVGDAMARPERIAARLFSLRAEGLLNGMTNATARARLSGLLIGAELAGAKPYWLGQQIAVIGAGNLTALYVRALALQSAPATQVKGDAITLAGLTAAYRRLKG
jgi:2-dehydro-3-deoxygalactonokinase